MENTIAIIPARGNSKGFPGKNVALCNKKPLITRAVETALNGGCEVVCVSTDCDKISSLAKKAGAIVHMRTPELSGDDVASEDVIYAVLKDLCVKDKVVLFQQCTSPLTTPEDVRACLDLVSSDRSLSVFTAVRFHAPIWARHGRSLHGINHNPVRRVRRQEWPDNFKETGALYCFPQRIFEDSKFRFSYNVDVVLQQPWQAIDIDTPDDLLVADALAKKYDPRPSFAGKKLLICDFDGCMTDNLVYTDSSGVESVCCSKDDSTGIFLLKRAGIDVHVLTHEYDTTIDARCRKLNILYTKTNQPKKEAFLQLLQDYGVDACDVVYMGNDNPDVECLEIAGISVCPSDSSESAKEASSIVLKSKGGHGAVRELAELWGVH